MGVGGKGSSESKSTTTNTAVNQQVGASEGAIAAGAGATVSINTLDAGLAETAIREIGGTAGVAIESTSDVAKSITSDAFDFASRGQETQNKAQENFLNFARSQGELVAASRGVETPDTSRNLVHIVGAAIIGGMVLLFRGKKGN